MKAGGGVDDGVEDGINFRVGGTWGVKNKFCLLDWGLKFVPVLGFVQVGVFVLECSYWDFKLG
jgi:hypothetical protein